MGNVFFGEALPAASANGCMRQPMRFSLIGNAGSGKSTLARKISAAYAIRHLELDRLVWREDKRLHMRAARVVAREIDNFIHDEHDSGWVVEGVYAVWIRRTLSAPSTPHLVWLDVPADVCAARVRERALPAMGWASDEERAKRHAFVEAWAASYDSRSDDDSREGHRTLFSAFDGPKSRVSSLDGDGDSDFLHALTSVSVGP
jgi:adenylate kinase family enzyme